MKRRIPAWLLKARKAYEDPWPKEIKFRAKMELGEETWIISWKAAAAALILASRWFKEHRKEYNRFPVYWPAFDAIDEELLAPIKYDIIYYDDFIWAHKPVEAYTRKALIGGSSHLGSDENGDLYGYCRSKEDHA